jgi:hypothetical protein
MHSAAADLGGIFLEHGIFGILLIHAFHIWIKAFESGGKYFFGFFIVQFFAHF